MQFFIIPPNPHPLVFIVYHDRVLARLCGFLKLKKKKGAGENGGWAARI